MAVRRIAGPTLAALALFLSAAAVRAESGKPLSETALSALVDQQIPDDIIIKKVETAGVAFPVDAETLGRLKQAGASDAVLAAVRQAGQPANAITYQGVLKMVRQGTSEDEILKRLEASPTTFTLDADQVAALRKAGASDRLLGVLQSNRNPVTTGSDISDFAVVLDCSGSMNDKTPDGVSKMESAKKVVTKFIRDLPNNKRLAFIVYGTDPKTRKCADVTVVQHLAPCTDAMKEKLAQYIDGLQAAGWTPLALGMQVAGTELVRSKGLCQLVVVTDGMESCKGDPGAVAEDLVKNINLPGGVDIIGFGVVPEEKAALNALEKKGKVNLYGAEDAAALTRKIKEAQDRAEAEAKKRAAEADEAAANEAATREAMRRKAAADKAAADKAAADKAAADAASKDDFPTGETVRWDVSKLEDAADDYQIVRRKVEGNQVTWVVKPKSGKATNQLNLDRGHATVWAARFLDEDGIEVKRIPLAQTPTEKINAGDPVSLSVKLPDDDVMKRTRKIVVELR